MIAILSPAKSLNTEGPLDLPNSSEPLFLKQANQLADQMRNYTPSDLATLMKISDKLSTLNAARFEEWTPNHESSELLPAIYAFNGDVYQGLDIASLSREEFERASQQIRILSGLYGLLRPMDAIRPYRLEMGTKFKAGNIRSLHIYWREIVTGELNKVLSGAPLINLASNEYSAAVNFHRIDSEVVCPVFKDLKNGEYKIISFYAKRARGLMARFIAKTNAETFEDLKAFNYAGYKFSEAHSKPLSPCFIRDPEAV